MSEKRPWQILERKVIYESPWINLHLAKVRLPDGTVIPDHHIVDYPRKAAGVVPIGDDGRILLIDHYRFITDSRGWEIPAGAIEEGESTKESVLRELREETGHVARSLIKLGRYHPSCGSSNQAHHIFVARGVTPSGAAPCTNEVQDVRWFQAEEVEELIRENLILCGLSLTGLLWAKALGFI